MVSPTRPLFPSRNRSGSVAMNRHIADDILKKAFIAAGFNGKLATHSLRKSFAQRVSNKSGDIYWVQERLGPRNVGRTQKYWGVNSADARRVCEAIALCSESDRRPLLSGSIKTIPDETLLLELARRGYDLSSFMEDDMTPAEIVKIMQGIKPYQVVEKTVKEMLVSLSWRYRQIEASQGGYRLNKDGRLYKHFAEKLASTP